jgi:hypothetical protein
MGASGMTVCPECAQGKPWNCTGWVLDDDDNEAPCATVHTDGSGA